MSVVFDKRCWIFKTVISWQTRCVLSKIQMDEMVESRGT